jgi:hypothetical protein
VCDGNNKIFKVAANGTKENFSKGASAPGVPGEEAEDSGDGLPDKYSKDYLVASSTLSPDKKFAVIYPTRQPEEGGNMGNYLFRCGHLLFSANSTRNGHILRTKATEGSPPTGRMIAQWRS